VAERERAQYKDTIRLPQTDFPMRANLAQREPETLARWQRERIYERALEARAGGPRYVFHDGPPYANGHIHYGHILNKILKDIVVKYQTLAGRYTKFVPGWDCHGLPIELGVERALAGKKAELSQNIVRSACRREAEKWVDVQREEFKRLGVFGTWAEPYLTLTPSFEQGVVEALGAFVRHGLVYRGKKPVHWCGRCKTALAEAEVEYIDHESPSIYVKFPVVGEAHATLAQRFGLSGAESKLEAYALIWTTTPWTLPANLAIAVHPNHEYAAVQVGDELWIVARALIEPVAKATHSELSVVGRFVTGSVLVGLVAQHPFEDRASPLLPADYVTLDTGTGLVHTAPGHGADDYSLGQAHGLDTFAPVDEAARFTNEVREEWRGLHVLEANPRIVHFLAEQGVLANREGDALKHSYPACWRCKNPIVFRATTQWFIALDTPMQGRDDLKTLRQVALDEIEAIAGGRDLPDQEGKTPSGFIPEWGRDRIHGMLADRPDWCISRQRAWGVPIPALHCKQCAHVSLDEALVAHVSRIIGAEGADAWFTRDASALVPANYRCTQCGGSEFSKDTSILDVWFESGASFWATMRSTEAGFGVPVDLYLEGSDQHRGWFHSSLLVGAAVLGRAPYKRVLTHGFVCDDQGRPYSKSELRRRQEAGEKVEYIEPEKLIKQQGAELLRLWVAYEDFRGDVRFSNEHLKQVSDAYFKIRNTLRFLLGNLHDFDRNAATPELDPLDAWAQARMRQYLYEVVTAYERYDFRTVYHRTVELCVGPWSQFYLDVVKDRLYCDGENAARRRSCQATLDAIARGTIAALAPIVSFTADEAYRCLPGEQDGSVFLDTKLQASPLSEADRRLLDAGEQLFSVRDALNAALEPKVKAKEIGHRREVAAVVTLPDATRAQLATIATDLAELFAIASVELRSGPSVAVELRKTTSPQCSRCWRHRNDVGTHAAHPELCERCAQVITALGSPQ
jgi:isoleucyl-tRNA synthetase